MGSCTASDWLPAVSAAFFDSGPACGICPSAGGGSPVAAGPSEAPALPVDSCRCSVSTMASMVSGSASSSGDGASLTVNTSGSPNPVKPAIRPGACSGSGRSAAGDSSSGFGSSFGSSPGGFGSTGVSSISSGLSGETSASSIAEVLSVPGASCWLVGSDSALDTAGQNKRSAAKNTAGTALHFRFLVMIFTIAHRALLHNPCNRANCDELIFRNVFFP